MSLGKPWQIIGYRKDGRPIHLIAGGAADVEDDDDTGLDLEGGGGAPAADEPDEPDDDADDEAEGKPEPKKVTDVDLKKVQGALEKERAANKDYRAKLREAQAKLREAQRAAQPRDGDDETVTKAVEEAVAAEQNRFKPMLVNKAARVALLEAGLPADTPDTRVKKLLRLLDLTDIDIDDDGEVSGLDVQIDQIRDDFPELFAKPEPQTPRVRAPRVDAADKKNVPPAPKTTGERYAAQILGNR